MKKFHATMAVVLVVGELAFQSFLYAVTFQPSPATKNRVNMPPLAPRIDADVYLNGANTVLFDQAIVPQTADTFAKAVMGQRILIGPSQPLYVLIASPGGYVDVGERIYTFLGSMENLTLICRFCASDAGLLFATFKGPRLVTDGTQFIMHEMFMDHVTGEMLRSQLDIAAFIQRSDDFNKRLYNMIGMSRQEYEKKIVKKEWELTGNEIVKNHLADRMVKVACDPYMKSLAPITCGVEGP